MDEATVAGLRADLGEPAVAGTALEVDGQRLAWCLRPEGGDALAAALRALSGRKLAAIVRGGGTRSGLGNPPRRADVVLSTEGIAGVRELDAEEGVIHVGGGTPLAAVEAALAGSGWELPLEAGGAASSVGGTLSAAAPGPRFVSPRDAVLGLEVVLASGARVRCGGRVVKNVTGYDLAKLFVGAHGSLGVIEAAWLRLRPQPERVARCYARLPEGDEGGARALDAARQASVRAALLSGGDGSSGTQLILELAGDEPAVEVAEAGLRERLGTSPAARDDLATAFAPALADVPVLRFRLALLPTRLAVVTRMLADAGARWLALPAHGLCWARFESSSPEAAPFVTAAARAVGAAARAGGGYWLLEAAPAAAKQHTDVFGDVEATLPLMRELKARFDPDGVLNPGRFAGRL